MLITIIGSFGLILLLTAFALNSLGKIDQKDKYYNLLNLLGAGILAYYAIVLQSYVFVVLESIWALVASYSLFKSSKGE